MAVSNIQTVHQHERLKPAQHPSSAPVWLAAHLTVLCASLIALINGYAIVSLTCVILFVALFSTAEARRPGGVMRLSVAFIVVLFAYTVAVPLSAVARFGTLSELESLVYAYCVVAMMAFLVGSTVRMSTSGSVRAASYSARLSRGIMGVAAHRWASLIVLALGVAGTLGAITFTVGLRAYLTAGYLGRAQIKMETGPIEIGLYIAAVGMLYWFATIRSRASMRKAGVGASAERALFWLMAIAYIVYVSFLGIRRPSFLLLAGIFVVVGRSGQKSNIGRTAIAATLCAIAFGTFAWYRHIIGELGVAETLSYIADNATGEWLDMSRTELGAPFGAFVHVLDRADWANLRLGESYLVSVPHLLPSRLGIDVVTLSEEYSRSALSHDLLARGGNLGFFPVAEAYINFGVWGVFLVFVLFGKLVVAADMWLSRRLDSPLALTMYATAIPWLMFFMRLDLATFLKGFTYTVLAPIALAVVLAGMGKRMLLRYGVLRTIGVAASDASRGL